MHLGYTPYCILSAASRTETDFLVHSVFIDVDPENFGNAVIYGQDSGDVVNDVNWYGTGFCSQSDTYKIAATTYDWLVRSGSLIEFHIDSSSFFPSAEPAVAWFYSSGNLIRGVSVERADRFLEAISGSPPMLRADGNEAVLCTWKDYAASGRFCWTHSALAAGQHLKIMGRDEVDIYGTADTGPSGGFAYHAADTDTIAAVITGGLAHHAIAGAAITVGTFLKPSGAVAGRVLTSTGYADGPVIGACLTTAAGAASTFNATPYAGAWNT